MNRLIDGNNSVTGVGVTFEGEAQGGYVRNVDVIHQGNGRFSSYSDDAVFEHVRTFDSFSIDQGRGRPSSNGLQFGIVGTGLKSYIQPTLAQAIQVMLGGIFQGLWLMTSRIQVRSQSLL
jgi:serralysin